jgi:hypothetical protein
MGLFGRHRRGSSDAITGADRPTRAALADEVTRAGWEPVAAPVFDSGRTDLFARCARALHGAGPGPISTGRSGVPGPHVDDAFRRSVDGREVVVANIWVDIDPSLWGDRPQDFHGASICSVELPSVPSFVVVQPRSVRKVTHIVWTPTGDAAFDAGWLVSEAPALGPSVLTPAVRSLVSAHDDWVFLGGAPYLTCVGFLAFTSAPEMQRRAEQLLAIVAAFPSDAPVAAAVDHSQDGLAARIARLDSIEDGLAFLQSLTPADRASLAASNTPLAVFADVTTPEEAMARFESLDPAHRLAVLTMFQRAGS